MTTSGSFRLAPLAPFGRLPVSPSVVGMGLLGGGGGLWGESKGDNFLTTLSLVISCKTQQVKLGSNRVQTLKQKVQKFISECRVKYIVTSVCVFTGPNQNWVPKPPLSISSCTGGSHTTSLFKAPFFIKFK